ncbi:Protein YIPF1 [Armadillidium vulgare]|nr:Protein YIPF1 [Armadillidium vulgare]
MGSKESYTILLDEDDVGETPKSAHSFWTFEFYQQFFDVDSKQVGDRIIWSMIPKPGVNFLKSYIRPNPDLYECKLFHQITSNFILQGLSGYVSPWYLAQQFLETLSNYLQSKNPDRWKYDFHLVTLATSCIFTYAMFVPILIWGVLIWRSSKSNLTLLELICLYGYSLAIFVPVSLLWMIPLLWLKWCLGIVASVLSGSVLVRTIQPALSHEAKKIAFSLAVLVLVLHAVLAIGFMLYFFYPPSSSGVNITAASTNNSVSNSVADSKLQKGIEMESQDKIVKNLEEQNLPISKDKKHERSENLENANGKPTINSAKGTNLNNLNVKDNENNKESIKSIQDKELPQPKATKEQSKSKPVIQSASLVKEEESKGKPVPQAMSLVKETKDEDIKIKKTSRQEAQNAKEKVSFNTKEVKDEKVEETSNEGISSNASAALKHPSEVNQTPDRKRPITMTGIQEKSII